MTKIAVAVGAILLLAGGAMLAVYLMSREPAPAAASPAVLALPPATQDPAPAPTAAPAPDLSRLTPAPLGPPPSPPVYGPRPPEPPPGTWEAVPPVPRLGRLGPPGAALNVRLNELQSSIATCFAQASARGGRVAETDNYTETKDAGQVAEQGAAVLMLHVEATAGALRIIDAPVDTQGSASPGAIACVQGLLRGQVVPAPDARTGERYRIPHVVTP